LKAGLTAGSRATLVPHRGTLRVRGMVGGAQVRFDGFGVPHVLAPTDADAFAALGVCHALDRFFQMDMMRRALRGLTCATVGERPLGDLSMPPFGSKRTTLDADRLVRALDVAPSAQRTLEHADEEGRALLDAYVAGVNAGVEVLRRRRPIEHRLLGLPLLPWEPLDSLVVAKGMALGLSFKWRTVPVMAALAERLHDQPERLEAVLPRSPTETCLAQARWLFDGVSGALAFLPPGPPAVGSNCFLVGGALTRSGKPILANDPHLQLGLPSMWYLASVRGARYAAVGATMAGTPGIVLGRSPTLAWGVTNAMIDDGDVWTEELDGTGTRYRVDGRWRDLSVETQEIPRRGRAPVLFRLRRTHRGPLLSDAFPGYEGPPLSLRTTWMQPGRDLEAFLGLARARSADEVPRAVAGYSSPAQNLLYADTAGAGGWRLMGRVPLRAHLSHPALPRDGRTAQTDWTGEIPPGEVPACALGPEDRIVSANHPQVDGSYPHYLSNLYEPDYRARRITALLGTRRDLTCDDLAAVQRDALDLGPQAFRAAVLLPHVGAVRRQRPQVARLLDLLVAWDGDSRPQARGAALWHLLYFHLARRVFSPLLGETLTMQWIGLMNLVDEPLLDAFRDPLGRVLPQAVRATVLGEALEEAQRDLAARGLPIDAPWGSVHTLLLKHPAGGAPFLGKTFHRGPFPMPGSPTAVCSGQYLHDRPCGMVVGPSFLHVVDLADPEGGRMLTFGGQSGHVGSPHYDDLTPLWRAGEWLPTRLEVPPSHGDLLTLEPA
jgi:penicillin amidase